MDNDDNNKEYEEDKVKGNIIAVTTLSIIGVIIIIIIRITIAIR